MDKPHVAPDQELRATYTLSLDSTGLFRVVFVLPGNPDRVAANNIRQAELICDDIRRAMDSNPGKTFTIFADVAPMGTEAEASKDAMATYENLILDPRIKKVAVHGDSFLQSIISAVALFLDEKSGKVKWFTNIAKALDWLQQP